VQSKTFSVSFRNVIRIDESIFEQLKTERDYGFKATASELPGAHYYARRCLNVYRTSQQRARFVVGSPHGE
jgi:hypothetical protein